MKILFINFAKHLIIFIFICVNLSYIYLYIYRRNILRNVTFLVDYIPADLEYIHHIYLISFLY